MTKIIFSVIPVGQKWKLARGEQQIGLYDGQVPAIRAGRRAANEALRGRDTAELQVLDYFGELRRIDLSSADRC